MSSNRAAANHGHHGPASSHDQPAQQVPAAEGRETADDLFAQSVTGLRAAVATRELRLRGGQVFDLRAGPVRKHLGAHEVRMLAYNGTIPGPALRVSQGDEVTVRFVNEIDSPTTVHWHGLRVDDRFDGMPGHGGPPPIAEGDSFTYELRFPDAGLYWYHPHVREDYAQEHGLYGAILVEPRAPTFWPAADSELIVAVDDILLEGDRVAPASRGGARRTMMGRFGNVMLLNGAVEPELAVASGAVTRIFLLNTANARTFNLSIPGARLKLVGADGGPFERETMVDSVVISPSERVVVDAFFDREGSFAIEHRTPQRTYRMGMLAVRGGGPPSAAAAAFADLRHNDWLTDEMAAYRRLFDRRPDKTLALVGEMAGMTHDMSAMAHGSTHHVAPIEWEDSMPEMNAASTPLTMRWRLIDEATGLANHDIDWSFGLGQSVLIRLRNDRPSDHPMQHPFHVHGQRFLVVRHDGVLNDNLAWKDTVLVPAGSVVDILVDMSNPGTWMAHCHIAEHLESNMMLMFRVG